MLAGDPSPSIQSDVSKPIRVFLGDGNAQVRVGLAELVEAEMDLTVSGHAGTVTDILDAVAATTPDVVVLDTRLADGNGIDVCRSIRARHDDVACLFFTSYLDPDWNRAFDAGAAGFLLKRLGGTELFDAIRALAQGDQLPVPSWTVE